MTLDNINALLKKWAPVVYLNPKEEYMPYSVEPYLELVELCQKGSSDSAGPPVEQSSLPSQTGDAYLKIPDDNTAVAEAGDLVNAPAYVRFTEVSGSGWENHYDIQYWFFYGFNGPAFLQTSFCSISVAPAGEHQGDWERVTVRIEWDEATQTESLVGVYYAEHAWGQWLTKNYNFETGTQQPIAYSGVNTHASYPRDVPDTYMIGGRTIGPLSGSVIDRVAQGAKWDCAKQHQLISVNVAGVTFPEEDWVKFPGRWGALDDPESGPHGPNTHSEWTGETMPRNFSSSPMTSIDAYYSPQDGQSYRCSSNFKDWNVSSGDWLKFEVVTTGGNPQPIFAIVDDISHAQDLNWYTGLADGVLIPFDYQAGKAGASSLYVATTPNQPKIGAETYTINVYLSQGS